MIVYSIDDVSNIDVFIFTCKTMTTSNTSFEHVLHNLHERNRIIKECKACMDQLLDSIKDTVADRNVYKCVLNINAGRIAPIYEEYLQTMERFEIGIISFIADYYNIIDQHSDQFHTKYLHNYSRHRGHYSPILSEQKNEMFDLHELVDIFNEHCYDLKHFKIHTDSAHFRRAREQTWAIYRKLSNYIATESVYDLSDLFIHEFENLLTSIKCVSTTDENEFKRSKSKLLLSLDDLDLLNKLRILIQQFKNIKLDFKPSEELLDYCECGNVMQAMAESSELVCDSCGYLYELKGTVFSDSQFYSQESIRYKHAGYEPCKHIRSWLERIQARETNTIDETQIMKIEACIKRDGIANKKRLTIEQLRRYLKDTGLTELNEHVALIKKIITGIAPPQLTFSETQDIANSFAKAVKAYNIIRPSNKSNLLYYPFITYKLIEMHVPDYNKRKNLLSFIHLQGTQTLIQNDTIWSQICDITKGFTYRPTDRYEYLD